MRQKDIRPAPARLEFKGMKFLITDRPSDSNIQNYILVSIFYEPRKHAIIQNKPFKIVYFFQGIEKK